MKILCDYYCPNSTDSQSFGVSGNQERVGFKEPYSTYFYEKDSADIFINSDQIPVSSDPLIFAGLISKL